MLCRLLSSCNFSSRNVLLAAILAAAMSWTTIATVQAQFPPSNGGGGYGGGNNGSGNGGGYGWGFSGSVSTQTSITCKNGRLEVTECKKLPGQARETCIRIDRSPFSIDCRLSDYYQLATVNVLSESTCGFRHRGIDLTYQNAIQSLQDRSSVLLVGADVSLALFQDPWDMEQRFRNPRIHIYLLRSQNGQIIKSADLSAESSLQPIIYNCAEFMSAGTRSLNDAVNATNDSLRRYNLKLEQICPENGASLGLTWCR
jgi:hypothetical protein